MARGAWFAAILAAAGAGLAAVIAFAPSPERALPPAADAPPPQAADGPPSTEPERQAPAFDVVRVEPDGRAMIAGTAEPGARVEITLDGAPLATATADASGAFAAEVTIAPGEGLRRLDLVDGSAPDGAAVAARDPVFVNAPAIRAASEEAAAADGGAKGDAQRPVVVAAREDGAELIQIGRRPRGGPVTLDLISYGPDGAVSLQGRAAPGRLVRVYAGGALIAEAAVGEDERWRATAGAELAPGVHTLRIDEIEGGRVVSRIETPFRREAPEALALNPGEVVVQPGDSLWRIAQARYGTGTRYVVIYEANADRIRDPDLIYPGQVFATPPVTP